MKKTVLGIKIDDIPMEVAVDRISSWLVPRSPLTPKLVVTPGPEFLVTAQKDKEFKKILNSADLAVPDGVGLKLAGIKNRAPGVNLMLRLCQEAAVKGWTIGLFGGAKGVAQQTASELIKRYPKIKIPIISALSSLKPIDLLFVALGHPKQEKFLAKIRNNLTLGARNSKLDTEARKSKIESRASNFKLQDPISSFQCLPSIRFRVGVGVGGAFDYISGRVPRPPGALQGLGLEWLWRLVLQPNRIRRILNATVVFPFLLLQEKLHMLS